MAREQKKYDETGRYSTSITKYSLSISPFQHPDEVAEQLGAVQAQDFAAAKWSIALLILLRPAVKQCT